MHLAEIDVTIYRRPFSAGQIKLLGKCVAECRWIKAALDYAGEAVGIRKPEPIHCSFVEKVIVGGENPGARQGTITQYQLSVECFVEFSDGAIAIGKFAVCAFFHRNA